MKHQWLCVFPKVFLLSVFSLLLLGNCGQKGKKGFTKDVAKERLNQAWDSTYAQIEKAITAPTFPDTLLSVSDTLDFRNRLNDAIENLSNNGGGTILIDSGTYMVKGSIFLKSNIRLHLHEGSELLFSPHPSDYLPVVKSRWEGTFLRNYSPLVYANGAENIAITGKGGINGQAEKHWYGWKQKQDTDKKLLRQMGNEQIPLKKRMFGGGHYLRPSAMEFIGCKNILLEDFSIRGSPFWTIHPVLSENVTIRGLRIGAGTTNDDGIDPESCKNVLIENCTINTHDDCIAIKAGRDQDGWPYPPSENIIIRNNRLHTEVGSGFCIGSEMSAGVRNVFVENCKLTHSGKHAFQFKSNPDRGGFIEAVYMRNLNVGTVKYGFEFTTDYKGWRGNKFYTRYEGFYFQNITIDSATVNSIMLKGRPEMPIENVLFEECTINHSPVHEECKQVQNMLFVSSKINGEALPTKK
ncbi:MAG: glycoside hydrolase family 28 protein [Bacteroidota bacterium]